MERTYEKLEAHLKAARTHFEGLAALTDETEDGSWQQAADALDEALDIIYDYQKQADRLSGLEDRERVTPPKKVCGAYVCQRCGRSTNPVHTYCHTCGQRQRREERPWRNGKNITQGRKAR